MCLEDVVQIYVRRKLPISSQAALFGGIGKHMFLNTFGMLTDMRFVVVLEFCVAEALEERQGCIDNSEEVPVDISDKCIDA